MLVKLRPRDDVVAHFTIRSAPEEAGIPPSRVRVFAITGQREHANKRTTNGSAPKEDAPPPSRVRVFSITGQREHANKRTTNGSAPKEDATPPSRVRVFGKTGRLTRRDQRENTNEQSPIRPVVHEAPYSVSQWQRVEVDEQRQWAIRQAKIGESLCKVPGHEDFDGLCFDDKPLPYKDIDSQRFVELGTLVDDWDPNFRAGLNSSDPKFLNEAITVDALQQPDTKFAAHLADCVNRLGGQSVEFRIKVLVTKTQTLAHAHASTIDAKDVIPLSLNVIARTSRFHVFATPGGLQPC